jgi:hypothetical protein
MNKLLFALYTLLTLAAPALAFAGDKSLSLLRLDLDADGKNDVLRVLEVPRAGRPEITDRVLQIRTTKDRQIHELTGLLTPVTYRGPQDSPCHTGISDSDEELRAGGDLFVSLRPTGEASFVVTEEYEDNGCSYYGRLEWQASLSTDGTLPLERMLRHAGHHGMGSGYHAKANFDFQNLLGEEETVDRTVDGETRRHRWKIPAACHATLDQIVKQRVPTCAEYRGN